MSKIFKIAIVGCGDIAGFIALVSKTLPNTKISACVSKKREEAQAFAKKHHVPLVFTDYQELLAHRNLFDAVYISTPHHLHATMIESAIELSIPVLCEKPITESLSTAKEIVKTVIGKHGKVGINYQYRYNPACQKLISYAHNDIGQLFYIRINIPWHRHRDYFESATWHKKIALAGGGTLITQGSHFLDIALLAARAKPMNAYGVTDQKVFKNSGIEIEDYAHGIINMADGSHIEITSSMVANPEQTGTIEVYGENGYAKFSAEKQPHFSYKGPKPSQGRFQLPFGIHPLARSIHGFKDWVQSDKPFLTPIHTALPVMTVIDAIYRSARSNQQSNVMID